MTGRGSGQCDHLGLFTNDADRLVRFYCRHFGFVVEGDDLLPSSLVRKIFGVPGACRFVKLSPEKGSPASLRIEVFQPLGEKLGRRRNGSVGCNHWGMSVGDRAAFARSLARRKVPVIEIVREGRQIYFVRDPDGNRIELRT